MQVSNISFCNNYNSFFNSQPKKSLDEFISDQIVADIEDRANAPCKYYPQDTSTTILGNKVGSLGELAEYAEILGLKSPMKFPESDDILDLYVWFS